MTAALEWGEWSAARPGRSLAPGKNRDPLYRRLGGPQGLSGLAGNLVATGIRSRTFQPVVSHYTDWATRPTLWAQTKARLDISFENMLSLSGGPGSSVGVATGYRLDGAGIESRWWAKFSAPVQTGSGTHPASCMMGTVSFPGGSKERLKRDADPSPLLVPW